MFFVIAVVLCKGALHAYSSTSLLPVLVEEEESVQDSTAEAPTAAASMPGRKKFSNQRIKTKVKNLIPTQ